MKKIKKPKKSVQVFFTESQVGALIEEFNSNIKIISENVLGLNDRFEKFQGEMLVFVDEMKDFKIETRENFKFVSKQMLSMENRLDRMDNRLDGIEERLSVIESEIKDIKKSLKQKVDKIWVKEKITYLEKELASLKMVVAE